MNVKAMYVTEEEGMGIGSRLSNAAGIEMKGSDL